MLVRDGDGSGGRVAHAARRRLAALPRAADVTLRVVRLARVLAALDAVRPVVVATRFAWVLVLLTALDAVRPVAVAAPLAVLLASPLPLRVDVTGPLAPDFAALAVLSARRAAAWAVPFAPNLTADVVRVVLREDPLTVTSPLRLAS
jgi:hypothetical protein